MMTRIIKVGKLSSHGMELDVSGEDFWDTKCIMHNIFSILFLIHIVMSDNGRYSNLDIIHM